MIGPDRDEHYWLGSLAMTVALASKDPDPHSILKPAVREFLRERPDDELARLLRQAMGGKP